MFPAQWAPHPQALTPRGKFREVILTPSRCRAASCEIRTAPLQASMFPTLVQEPTPRASARAERLLDTTTTGTKIRCLSAGSCAHRTGRIPRLLPPRGRDVLLAALMC